MRKNGPISFEEFIGEITTNNCVASSITAREIYDGIICREDVRIKMAELSDADITALTACATEIEEFCKLPNSDLSLDTKVIRQTIGRMVAASLEPLGYVPYKRGRVNAGKSSVFTTAKVYKKDRKNAREIIIKKIVDAKEQVD